MSIFKKKSKIKILIAFAKSKEMRGSNYILLIMLSALIFSCIIAVTPVIFYAFGIPCWIFSAGLTYYLSLSDSYHNERGAIDSLEEFQRRDRIIRNHQRRGRGYL